MDGKAGLAMVMPATLAGTPPDAVHASAAVVGVPVLAIKKLPDVGAAGAPVEFE